MKELIINPKFIEESYDDLSLLLSHVRPFLPEATQDQIKTDMDELLRYILPLFEYKDEFRLLLRDKE